MKFGLSIDIVNPRNRDSTIPFIPSDIADCILWLRSDYGVEIGVDGVYSWLDMSGLSNHVVQPNPAYMPQHVSDSGINGHPGVEFFQVPGEALHLFRNGFGTFDLQQACIVAVGRLVNPYAPLFMVNKGSYNSFGWNYGLGLNAQSQASNFWLGNDIFSVHQPQAENALPKGIVTQFAPAFCFSYLATPNDTYQVALTLPYISLPVNNNPLVIGTTFDSDLPSSLTFYQSEGIICEIIIYNRILTNPELLNLYYYLSTRYNLASPI